MHPPDDRSVRSFVSPRAWLVTLIGGAVAIATFLAMPPGSTEQTLTFLGLAVVFIGLAGSGILRERATERLPWVLMAGGQGLFVLGDGLWTWFDLRGEEPFPSIADVLYLSGYLFIGGGLVLAIRRRIGGGDRAGLLDAAILTTGAWVIWWEVLLGPTAAVSDPEPLAFAISVAYPIADLILIGLAVGLLLTPGARTASFRLLLVSLGSMLVADLLFGIQSLEGTYADGGAADVLWLAAYVAFAAATLHPSMVELIEPHPVSVTLLGRVRLALLAVAMLVGPVLLTAGDAAAESIVAVVAGATAMLSVLVLARLAGLVGALQQDIARRAILEEQLSFQAFRDPLTGLANRRGFMTAVGEALGRRDVRAGVLFLDLDDFKDVNDELGHEAGDALLRAVGERLNASIRPGDLAGRLGGDEFAILMPDAGDGVVGPRIADRLLDALDDPIRLGRSVVAITASLGVALREPGESIDVDGLLRRADVAMYHAKAAGKHRWAAYDATIHGPADVVARTTTRGRSRPARGARAGQAAPTVDVEPTVTPAQPSSNERFESPQAKPSIA